MGDLISREALYKAMNENPESNGNARAAQLLECIMKAPSVDAVEVVRCKDCLFSFLMKDSDLRNESPWCYYRPECRFCHCKEVIEDEPLLVEDDFFCKCGVKRQ